MTGGDLFGGMVILALGVAVLGAPRKTDPSKACDKPGHLGWAIVHDALAHPFMALTGFSRIGVRFHDWTSHKAWPRKRPMRTYAHFTSLPLAEAYRDRIKLQGRAVVLMAVPGEGYYVGELQCG